MDEIDERVAQYLAEMDRAVRCLTIPEVLCAAIDCHASWLGCTPGLIRAALEQCDNYTVKRVPKKRGGQRVILIPPPELKLVQSIIGRWLKFIWPDPCNHKDGQPYFLYGFGYCYRCWNSSSDYYFYDNGGYVAHAARHKDSNWFFQFDIKDAFSSVRVVCLRKIVSLIFKHRILLTIKEGNEVMNPVVEDQDVIAQVVDLIMALTTCDGILPQGPPSSPFLFFIYLMEDPIIPLAPFQARIPKGVWPCLIEALPAGYKMSGYVDNVCISGKNRVPDESKQKVITMFERIGLKVHKIREQHIKDGSPTICGLRISDIGGARKIVWPQDKVGQFRAMIHNWNGYDKLPARRIKGMIDALKPIYGDIENLPGQIRYPLEKIGIQNVIRAAAE